MPLSVAPHAFCLKYPRADVDREISAQKIAINARARLVAGAWLDAVARDASGKGEEGDR